MIRFKKVSKKFGEVTALEEVNFEVAPQEFVFLTGPSGSGKTTLIRLITRELRPTSGEIFVNDLNLNNLQGRNLFILRRQIGVVFQDFKLLLDRTIRENVALVLEVAGKDISRKDRVEEVLEQVGILEQADFFPSQLAGGELQRACLARALAADPEILIADEPTGNLDITTAWQIINLLQAANRQGKTVLVATHNVEIVDSLKSRVIELDKGRIIRDEKKGDYQIK
ncbi:MAG: ATP-binding cassette domain-containing protein [Candidatus Pacebacteria bacterium]|nr:ATP-binding cassette domain-containing protein [Candidatus Paceibacterota bacterium]